MQSKREPVNQEMSNLFSISSCTSSSSNPPMLPIQQTVAPASQPTLKKTFAPFSPLVPSIMSKTPGLGCCYCILPATYCHFSYVSPTTRFFINSDTVIAVCTFEICIHKNFKNKKYYIVYLLGIKFRKAKLHWLQHNKPGRYGAGCSGSRAASTRNGQAYCAITSRLN